MRAQDGAVAPTYGVTISGARRRRPLLLALLLALMLTAIPMSPTLATSITTNCTNVSYWGHTVSNWGEKFTDTSGDVLGVEASYPAMNGWTDLQVCQHQGNLNLSQSTVWDSIEQLHNNNGGEIVQIGMTRIQGNPCPPIPQGFPCDVSNIHYFVAWGTCYTGLPGCGGPFDLGPTPVNVPVGYYTGGTNALGLYMTMISGIPMIVFEINGHMLPSSVAKQLSPVDVPWAYQQVLHGGYACETWDTGDACGGQPAKPYYMGSMVFKLAVDGPWIRNPVSVKACELNSPPYHCQVIDNQTVDFYTPLR